MWLVQCVLCVQIYRVKKKVVKILDTNKKKKKMAGINISWDLRLTKIHLTENKTTDEN